MDSIIPDVFWKGFDPFLRLEHTKRIILLKEIAETDSKFPLSFNSSQLAEKTGIPANEVEEIITHLVGLIIIKESSQIKTDDFINSIAEELKDIYEKESKITINTEEIVSHLKSVFNTSSTFYISVKSKELNSERERLLNNVKILTDLRPVFTDDGNCDLKKVSVIHTLKIMYKERENTIERYYALDNIDLIKLKHQVDRAILKEEGLKKEFGNFII